MLAVLVHLNVRKLADIKLPCRPVDRLHLNRHMSATLTGRDDVVVWNVSSERRCKEIETAQFGCYEKLSNCARQLGSSSRCHALTYSVLFFELEADQVNLCLLYTSDAADDLLCVDLGGRRII